jgi:ligand-binding SRPBCC domain-containing protein
MATYRRRTRVRAPLDEVWAFHSSTDGLEALTPGWMGLTVSSVRGPDGIADPDELVEGSEISMRSKPFGVFPESRWISKITDRREGEGYRMFRDSMLGGPFDLWIHTHEMYGDGHETVLIDTVEYELPSPLGGRVDPAAIVGFEPMFRYRHRKTKEILEGDTSTAESETQTPDA